MFLIRILGFILFLPMIGFYSYVLGPVLKLVLVPGGLTILFLILGPKQFRFHFNRAFDKSHSLSSNYSS